MFGRAQRDDMNIRSQRVDALENLVMVNLPRIATVEFRMHYYTMNLCDLERRTDRVIQQHRGAQDLQSPEPITAGLADAAPLFTEGASTNSNDLAAPVPGSLPSPAPAQALASPQGSTAQYGSGAPVGAPVSGGDNQPDPIHGDSDPRTTRQMFEDLCGITPPPHLATPPST